MNKKILYIKFCIFAKDCLQYISDNEQEYFKFNISNYYQDYPLISYSEIGYPIFTNSSFSKKNYSGLFYKNWYCQDIDSSRELQSLLAYDDRFCKLYEINENKIELVENGRTIFGDSIPFVVICQIIKRYINSHSILEFQDALFKPIFEEWYCYYNSKILYFDIVVPILMITFDFEEFIINEELSIVKMDELFQRSRNKKSSYNSSSHDRVISSATHAFVWKALSIPNETRQSVQLLSDYSSYSNIIFTIESLFSYIRIKTSYDLGYCQIIVKPNGWSSGWYADLMELHIASKKFYPDYFENYYWDIQPPVISKDIFIKSELSGYFGEINENVKLAIRRLNNAYLKRDKDDSILDITIALEALIMDKNDNTEVTHKLATRIGTLYKLFPNSEYTSSQVFRICKKIYDFRSNIIHSKEQKKVNKSRVIQLESIPEIKSVEAGLKVLSFIINILIVNPKYNDVKNIDDELFST